MAALGPDDRKKIQAALRKISDAWTHIEAARDTVKTTKKELCKDLELDRKAFTKVAKVFHKQNFGEEEQSHEEFKSMYKSLTGK